jgi:hypothetical protein
MELKLKRKFKLNRKTNLFIVVPKGLHNPVAEGSSSLP